MFLGFSGTYSPRIDDKFRLTLPAKFRAELATGVVVTMGQDHCLELLTHEGYVEKAKDWARRARSNAKYRNVERAFNAGADIQQLDAQGRISLSPAHRTWAGLTKDCTVIGRYRTVEVWDTESWETVLAGAAQDLAEALMDPEDET